MYTLAVFITVAVAVFLIIVILLQSSKGGGLAGTFGGGGISSMFGTRRTADFLSRATWWLAGALLVLILVINLFLLPGRSASGGRESVIKKNAQPGPVQPTLPGQK
jgi:preprotein translocase subunit SecG